MTESDSLGKSLALGFYSKHYEAMDEFAWAGEPCAGVDPEHWSKELTEEVGEALATVFINHKDELDRIYSAAEEDVLRLLRASKEELESALTRLGLSLTTGKIRVSRAYWQVTAFVRPRKPGPVSNLVLGFRVFIAAVDRELSVGLSLLIRHGSGNDKQLARTLAEKGHSLPTGINADLENGEVLLWSSPLLGGKAEKGIEPVDLGAVLKELKRGLNSLTNELFRHAFEALKRKP